MLSRRAIGRNWRKPRPSCRTDGRGDRASPRLASAESPPAFPSPIRIDLAEAGGERGSCLCIALRLAAFHGLACVGIGPPQQCICQIIPQRGALGPRLKLTKLRQHHHARLGRPPGGLYPSSGRPPQSPTAAVIRAEGLGVRFRYDTANLSLNGVLSPKLGLGRFTLQPFSVIFQLPSLIA